MTQFKCRICSNTDNNILHEAREMMFGFRDKFNYAECFNCRCIQITEIPKNIEKFYPTEYYSFSDLEKVSSKYHIKRLLNILRIQLYLNFFSFLRPSVLPLWFNTKWLKPYKVNRHSKILDVGCGNGMLLHELYHLGFSRLTGIDPYIKAEKHTEHLKILKQTLENVKDKYDFIMLNHSFEHIEEPIEAIQYLSEILSPNGTIMIRIPVASCYAWKEYGINWVQLDAPRHFFIHSTESISKLCKIANLKIDSIQYDSTSFQFYGSELYKKDIPLYKSSERNDLGFSDSDLKEFYQKAMDLNKNNDGDQACFFLTKDS